MKQLGENVVLIKEFTMTKEKRFVRIYTQDMSSTEIWVDKETGVNYLFRASGNAGGLTVLLDKYGKPVITPVERTENQ